MSFFSPFLEQAIELAAEWHDHTYRKSRWREPGFDPPEESVVRVPTMAHVTAVALSVQRAGWEDPAVAAAFLHDVLEDANRYGQTYVREVLLERMGEEVTRLVDLVTEQKYDADGTPRRWRERKEGYLDQLRRAVPQAVAISLADKVHNLWTMNASLAMGIDVFRHGPDRRALGAGPADQRWFYESVVEAGRAYDDDRLPPMRLRLEQEIDRFVGLTGV